MWTILPEPAEREVDDARVARRDVAVGQTEASHHPGAEVLHQHVAPVREVPHHLPAGLGPQVHGEALLATMHLPVDEGAGRVGVAP